MTTSIGEALSTAVQNAPVDAAKRRQLRAFEIVTNWETERSREAYRQAMLDAEAAQPDHSLDDVAMTVGEILATAQRRLRARRDYGARRAA